MIITSKVIVLCKNFFINEKQKFSKFKKIN